MKREIKYNGKTIEYILERKRVKNINLRVKPDGTVYVSANNRVSKKYIDAFVLSKAKFILSAKKTFEENNKKTASAPLYSESEFVSFISGEFCRVYKLFLEYKINRPQLKLRKMKSRWGSCNYVKEVITLSTNLIYCTKEQISYVIVHEFAHLLVHNHSEDFYSIVSQFVPDYKRIRKEMNNIILR